MEQYELKMPHTKGPKVRNPSKSQKILSEKLKDLRDNKGVAMETLAKNAKINRRNLYNMIGMLNATQINSLDAIAGALGVEAWTLLHPNTSAEVLEIITFFTRSDENGKDLFRTALLGAKLRLQRQLGEGDGKDLSAKGDR
jgi:transcriptional regulator with XRE-family HTH domain